MTVSPAAVSLLTRAGCHTCEVVQGQLAAILVDFGLTAEVVDVDAAAATDPDLRAEYGDRVPVVLLNGREHSYWDVDEARLRDDLTRLGLPNNV